ncbi:GMP synthase large subunit (glutamine-hydrolyzing) [Mycoplasmopsis californica]|uniref:GMP synthase [glutamine-hydrolyzing] n=1 Tax=Mycoplasmopsis equigenitalium TaxID=114883 RepID=A0ABY5J1Y6_9BACT|nr:glutamine-hydrolyzing GMP synthase [Mycoplasmopsis equigenitalium]UUD37265.1 glutamine-hydrolyzing GMP synthase [Mycoplasmopsis equigenitalium]VEU69426.1 GMP synthase large subunit (glutamine-hydrolyzing) [Mycoplasmopsis californica]
MEKEFILVLDFGGQYNQLIARRVRENGVYCIVKSYKTSISEIKKLNPKGIILTGGPNSVYDQSSPHADKELFELEIPILGICYGAQLMAYTLGGKVATAPISEYGKTIVKTNNKAKLFTNVSQETNTWMSHTDYIKEMPQGFIKTAQSSNCPVVAMENNKLNLYAVQFHPEVTHTKEGNKMFKAFLFDICKCKKDWKMKAFVKDQVLSIRKKVGNGKALCALSGGVDSSVAAVIMAKAIGKQLTCVFVDHGLLRKNEAEEVTKVFGKEGSYDINFVKVDARERFYTKLKGVTDPEIKRKVIGEEFIRVFEEEAKRIGAVDFLVQGTIYPDVIESGLGDSAVIKSHHNVGGLPEYVDFKEIIEPLRDLFKDEVRKVGLELGLSDDLVYRQPFPGPGLGIRIIGEVTAEKVNIVQEADYIFREEITKAGLNKKVSQYFAALSNMKSVGVKGDFRTYDYAIVLRAISTEDFMTAEAIHLPWNLLEKVTSRIVNEVKHINRVFYDCTGKPPGTVEFE